MVWIGLHGVMFLFLFSDFYKSKYTSIKSKSKKLLLNGTLNGSNDGACMVSVLFNYYILCVVLCSNYKLVTQIDNVEVSLIAINVVILCRI